MLIIQIKDFPGFYESTLDGMIDDEIAQTFDCDGTGCNPNIPEEFYRANIDYNSIHESQAKYYAEVWCEGFKNSTGIDLQAKYESFTSPKYYNFETDRLFIEVPEATITALFAESAKDNHNTLAQVIKENCTSYDGFISHYSNDLGDWLAKPVLTWDHNELAILLTAIAKLHDYEPDTWDLMESYQCNGNLSNVVCDAIPKEFLDFADAQREFGEAVNFGIWQLTGKCYPLDTDPDNLPELPPKPCKHTLDMFSGSHNH